MTRVLDAAHGANHLANKANRPLKASIYMVMLVGPTQGSKIALKDATPIDVEVFGVRVLRCCDTVGKWVHGSDSLPPVP